MYNYASSDSLNNIDPSGATVRIVTKNGGNIDQYRRARSYTGDSLTSNANRTKLVQSMELYTIVVDPQGTPDYNEDSNTIVWNPNSAMRVAAGIQSSAMALEHEVAHAVHDDEVGNDEFKKGEKPSIDVKVEGMSIEATVGESPNEVIAVRTEQAISEELGGSDPARQDYNESRAGDEVYVDDPTWHCKNPNCPK